MSKQWQIAGSGMFGFDIRSEDGRYILERLGRDLAEQIVRDHNIALAAHQQPATAPDPRDEQIERLTAALQMFLVENGHMKGCYQAVYPQSQCAERCQVVRAALQAVPERQAVKSCSRCYPVCEHWTEPERPAADTDNDA